MVFENSNGILLPPHVVDYKVAPGEFLAKLQTEFGENMHAEWNDMRKKWVVEQCVGACCGNIIDGVRYHNHGCNRSYVWLVREEDDSYMSLGDRVIDKLRELDTSKKFGTGEVALARFIKESDNIDKERDQKFREKVREEVRYMRKFNRVTFNKMKILFDKHSMKPNR